MAIIVGINGEPIDPLAIAISDELTAHGSVSQDLHTLTVTVTEWRKTARTVARQLGRPVQTLLTPDAVHAILRDWPADDREQVIQQQALREVAEAAAFRDELLEPISPCPACGNQREWKPAARFDQPDTIVCPRCGLVEVAHHQP